MNGFAEKFRLKNYRLVVCLFFVFYFFGGCFAFHDYGISWDEPSRRAHGTKAYQFVTDKSAEFITKEKYHSGPIFEIFLVFLESKLQLNDTRDIFLMRHFVTFLLFYVGVICFYFLCQYRFSNWKLSLLGCLFLVLTPRIFAHSFYNSKDIPFLAVFLINIYSMLRFLDKRTWQRALWLGFLSGVLVNIRILGLMIPALTTLFYLADLVFYKNREHSDKNVFIGLGVYLLSMLLFTIMFWPFLLQPNMLEYLQKSIVYMSQYKIPIKVFYLGEYHQWEMPRHYYPVWIAITTPLLYLIFFCFGMYTYARKALVDFSNFYQKRDLLFFLWFLLPLTVVMLSTSTKYDGWRHLFFIYPAFLIIALNGIQSFCLSLKEKTNNTVIEMIRSIFVAFIACSLILTLRFIIKCHPYQNVYFNPVLAQNEFLIANNFELDYWGLSYRQGLEYILQNDSDEIIPVAFSNLSGLLNLDILQSQERKRLIFSDIKDAKYFLSNYRWHHKHYFIEDDFYSIRVNGVKILSVFKMSDKQ